MFWFNLFFCTLRLRIEQMRRGGRVKGFCDWRGWWGRGTNLALPAQTVLHHLLTPPPPYFSIVLFCMLIRICVDVCCFYLEWFCRWGSSDHLYFMFVFLKRKRSAGYEEVLRKSHRSKPCVCVIFYIQSRAQRWQLMQPRSLVLVYAACSLCIVMYLCDRLATSYHRSLPTVSSSLISTSHLPPTLPPSPLRIHPKRSKTASTMWFHWRVVLWSLLRLSWSYVFTCHLFLLVQGARSR